MKIAHICLYPERGQKHVSESGVASYTKNLLTNMPKDSKASHFVICARKDGQNSHYQEDGVVVIRCFDRSWRFAAQINKQLRALNPDVVHIQHELSLFGGLATSYLLPVLIWLWRQKTTVTMHGVLGINKVDKSFVKANGYWPAPVWVVKLGLKVLYWPLTRLPKRVVVHEPYFKQLLVQQYGAAGEKIAVIAHGVEDFAQAPKQKARAELSLSGEQKVVLFMGYAAGYKGIDQLIEGFAVYAKTDPNAFLIIGAGAHPKFKSDKSYQSVYKGYQQKASQLIPASQYRWVGFIPEDQVATYYSAANVSVYPYTTALASSGPMAFAIGFDKPFLASSAFSDVFDNQLIFDCHPQALAAKLQEFFDDTGRFDGHVARLRAERLWPRTSLKTIELYKQIG